MKYTVLSLTIKKLCQSFFEDKQKKNRETDSKAKTLYTLDLSKGAIKIKPLQNNLEF